MNIQRIINMDNIEPQQIPLVYAMLARIFLLGVILVSLITFADFDLELQSVSVFMAITFLLSIAYTSWLQEEKKAQHNALYQFMVDIFIVTGLVHFTGGITSTLSLLYPLVILVAGVIVSGKVAIKVAILAVFLYATLVVLEASEILPYRGIGESPYANPYSVLQIGLMQLLLFVFFTGTSSYLADRLFFHTGQLQRLRCMAKSTLSSVSIPLLAVQQPRGTVRLANPAACRALQKTEKELENSFFDNLFVDQSPSLAECNATEKNIYWIKKGDGSKFPATLEISSGSLPAAVLNIFHDGQEDTDINLVAFRDMTEIMANEENIRNDEKTHTAVGMITEMAHVVRNPLTAIRGASELINAAVESALSQQKQITVEEFSTLKSMCEIIFEQTKHLNNRVEDFMRYASSDQAKLMELINNANLWGERILHGEERKKNTADSDC